MTRHDPLPHKGCGMSHQTCSYTASSVAFTAAETVPIGTRWRPLCHQVGQPHQTSSHDEDAAIKVTSQYDVASARDQDNPTNNISLFICVCPQLCSYLKLYLCIHWYGVPWRISHQIATLDTSGNHNLCFHGNLLCAI